MRSIYEDGTGHGHKQSVCCAGEPMANARPMQIWM